MWCHAKYHLLGYRLILLWGVWCYGNIASYHKPLSLQSMTCHVTILSWKVWCYHSSYSHYEQSKTAPSCSAFITHLFPLPGRDLWVSAASFSAQYCPYASPTKPFVSTCTPGDRLVEDALFKKASSHIQQWISRELGSIPHRDTCLWR
jgi:hypothetical protein